MAITFNADTSNGLVMTPDTSGEIKLQSAGVDIATVSSTGIAMASGKTLPASALTGTLPAIDGSSLTNLPQPSALTTASGSAPSYSARAWVNFQGTGTVTIRSSGNVTSVSDNGIGDYTINFSTAMPSANYAVSFCGGVSGEQGGSDPIADMVSLATGSLRTTVNNSDSGAVRDYSVCTFVIFV